MKRQIRFGVFETNSSSTHSLTMMMKDDYERWQNGDLYLYTGYGWGWTAPDCPVGDHLYTRDEAVEFIKHYKYYDNSEIDEDWLRDAGFISYDNHGSEYLESFYDEFTTPSGETVVCFGEYGYDG